MYKDTTTQNLPFRHRLSVEIDLSQGDMSATGRQLYANQLAARLDVAKEEQEEQQEQAITTTTATRMTPTQQQAGLGQGGGPGRGRGCGRGHGCSHHGRSGQGQGGGPGQGAGGGQGRGAGDGQGRGDKVVGLGRDPVPGRGSTEQLLLQNPVSVQDMRDGIVDKGVYARYCNYIILVADWAAVNQPDWFTPFGFEKYSELKESVKDKTKFVHQKQTKAGWMVMLKNSHNVAVFDLTKITAQRFMEYVSAQANQETSLQGWIWFKAKCLFPPPSSS
jgi:hypothetical protein